MLASRATFAIQDATIMTKDPRWLTRAEAAQLIGVDVVTVWRWSKPGGRLADVRTYTPGKQTMYWRDDIVAFVRQHGGQVDDQEGGQE